jgi:hypothetical protein
MLNFEENTSENPRELAGNNTVKSGFRYGYKVDIGKRCPFCHFDPIRSSNDKVEERAAALYPATPILTKINAS